jgi:uncharacterized protein with PIN domain
MLRLVLAVRWGTPIVTRYGSGIKYARLRHRAGLNYGDCFSYAPAISTGDPLLFNGDDFVHADDVTAVDLG